jgi:L-ascorbate metabolism protein UlaG (beta-lactamase superfamily)
MNRGPVLGFVLTARGAPDEVIYFGGDTVWYKGVAEVARKFRVRMAILNIGAGSVPQGGPFHLTMTADEAVLAARAFSNAALFRCIARLGALPRASTGD